ASQVPSGVLMSTLVSTTGRSAAEAEPAAAPRPAASDSATKSRRDSPPGDAAFDSGSWVSSAMVTSCLCRSHRLQNDRSARRAGYGWRHDGGSIVPCDRATTASGFYASRSHESAGVVASKCSEVAWFGAS